MRNAGGDLLHDALDLGQLVHQVLLVVESPSRIDQDHVVPLGDGAFHGVEGDGGGVGVLALSDEIGPGALSPNPQLVYGRGPERVGGPDGDLEAPLGELVAEFADGRGLAHAVDSDDQENIGAFGLRQVQVCGLIAPVGFEHAGDFLAEHGQQTVDGGGVLPGGTVLDALHDLHRGLHADVTGDQGLLELFEHVGVDVLLAGAGPGELLGTEDSLEEGHGVKVGVDATRAGFRSIGSRPSPASWADGLEDQLANQAFTSSLCTTS